MYASHSAAMAILYAVKHVYFVSIKFSRIEKNREIKYTRIFGIAHYHKFICIEYQHFRDMMLIFLVIYNLNNNTIGILIIKFGTDTKRNRKQTA